MNAQSRTRPRLAAAVAAVGITLCLVALPMRWATLDVHRVAQQITSLPELRGAQSRNPLLFSLVSGAVESRAAALIERRADRFRGYSTLKSLPLSLYVGGALLALVAAVRLAWRGADRRWALALGGGGLIVGGVMLQKFSSPRPFVYEALQALGGKPFDTTIAPYLAGAGIIAILAAAILVLTARGAAGADVAPSAAPEHA